MLLYNRLILFIFIYSVTSAVTVAFRRWPLPLCVVKAGYPRDTIARKIGGDDPSE
jgi:hypothetical protein